MNRRRIGQLLIGGVFAACSAAVMALNDLIAREDKKQKQEKPPRTEAAGEREQR